MPTYNARSGNKWSIPELITLQREYELLELTVDEIAQRHKRTVFAILARLESEGIITVWATARGYMESNIPVCGDDESDDSDGSYDDEDDYDSELEYQADNNLPIEVLAQGEDEDFLPLMRQFQTLHRFNDLPVNGNIDANMN